MRTLRVNFLWRANPGIGLIPGSIYGIMVVVGGDGVRNQER